jgi:serine/threonine-protein kinase
MLNDFMRDKIEKLFGTSVVRFAVVISTILASAALFGLLSLNFAIKRGKKTPVPNVVNKSIVAALDTLSEHKLELRKTDSRNSSFIPESYIVSQDPIPGTIVKEGSAISVVISLGSRIALVPDVSGRSLREAGVDLSRAALEMGRISKMHSKKDENVVLAQSPSANEQVERDTVVNMLVSLGPRPREYRLPNFLGQPMERVDSIIDAMDISIGDLTRKVDLTLPKGTILDQEPPPGSLVKQGSSISIVMSGWHGEGEDIERKFGVFFYMAPYGFWPRSVRVDLADPDGVRTIYDEVDEPGASIRLIFGYWSQCTVRVYLDNNLAMERKFR